MAPSSLSARGGTGHAAAHAAPRAVGLAPGAQTTTAGAQPPKAVGTHSAGHASGARGGEGAAGVGPHALANSNVSAAVVTRHRERAHLRRKGMARAYHGAPPTRDTPLGCGLSFFRERIGVNMCVHQGSVLSAARS
jgi:hypothetical protein